MEERQIIKKIKELRQIKPNKDWVSFTKNQIFGRELEELKTSPFSIFHIPIRRPALVVSSLVLMAALLGGLFVYVNFQPQLPQMADISKIFKSYQEAREISGSLEELQVSLSRLSSSLNDLKDKKPSQALAFTEVVKETASRGSDIIEQIKATSPSKRVLAALGEVENSFKEIEERSAVLQKEMIKDYIEYLRGRSLTEEGQNRLEKAEEYYNQGQEEEARVLLMMIVI